MDLLRLDLSSGGDPFKPKYLQLADAIIRDIEKGRLGINQRLPSVNQISAEVNVSRETVFKALNYLSEKGIIKSANRRGYFIQKIDVKHRVRIFLLLDKFTASFKEELYYTFLDSIGEQGDVDVYFHHHNFHVFENLIRENLQNYTHFVIVTYMREDPSEILNLIPPEKRLILDCFEPGLKGEYSMVYQDFARDIFKALSDAKPLLEKYKRLKLVSTQQLYHKQGVEEGFNRFCQETGYPGSVVETVEEESFGKGDVYITIHASEVNMVQIIKYARAKKYKLGRDVGLISYNDTPVKEVLEGGITVISTDFGKMGKDAAKLILDKETQTIINPTKLILRNSL